MREHLDVTEDPRRQAAISHLKAKRDLAANAVSFVVVNAFLTVIWAVGGRGFFWPVFVMAGWGVGLVLHAWSVFGAEPITEADIQREMERGDGDVVA